MIMNGLVASKFDTPINHDSMEAISLSKLVHCSLYIVLIYTL